LPQINGEIRLTLAATYSIPHIGDPDVIKKNHEGERKPQTEEITRTDKGQRNLKTTVPIKLIKHTYNVEKRFRGPESRAREHPASQI